MVMTWEQMKHGSVGSFPHVLGHFTTVRWILQGLSFNLNHYRYFSGNLSIFGKRRIVIR
jgi:hypothetical protein